MLSPRKEGFGQPAITANYTELMVCNAFSMATAF
jgi:hypothetical protein